MKSVGLLRPAMALELNTEDAALLEEDLKEWFKGFSLRQSSIQKPVEDLFGQLLGAVFHFAPRYKGVAAAAAAEPGSLDASLPKPEENPQPGETPPEPTKEK